MSNDIVLMKFDDKFYDELLEKAAVSERRRMNFDLRNGSEDGSQRMLNAILPESVVPIHRHHGSNESVALLRGSVTETFYEVGVDGFLGVKEVFELKVGDVLQIPRDMWHTIVANEPSVIMECKDGSFRPLAEDEVL